MNFDEILWEDFDSIEKEKILKVEQILGVKFPDEYKNCVTKYHGGNPVENKFSFICKNNRKIVSCLGVLLRFDEKYEGDNIINTINNISGQIPEKIIPFADDGGGDLICFDFKNKNGDLPKIVYWHHERNLEESITPVCDSFSDFIEMLG